MKKLKGIGLLLLSNILIIATLSITFTILSQVLLPFFGIDIRGIVSGSNLLFAAFFGFGGAFLSLAMSKMLAKRMVGASPLTQPQTQEEVLVFETIQKISERLKVKMPEVYIYESPDPNAFATGPSRNNSMVAVSTGLLQNLNQNEIRAVLAHEMGHVYNGDMFYNDCPGRLDEYLRVYHCQYHLPIFGRTKRGARLCRVLYHPYGPIIPCHDPNQLVVTTPRIFRR